MEKNFLGLLHSCAQSLFEFKPQIEFEITTAERAPPPERLHRSHSHNLAPPVTAAPSAIPEVPSRLHSPSRLPQFSKSPELSQTPKVTRKELNGEFTFENFVVGPPNRVAQAAAIAVCDAPGRSYNPLFVYGEPGIGKTHLLHAICHRLIKLERLKITYLSSEEFLNQFIASVLSSDRESFRSSCRDTDVLVLDDIQFLSQKEKTQDELFHTFNVLMENNRQIILSSCSSPRETAGLQSRLASRFQWGLVTRMDCPDFELRVAILLSKARMRHMDLPIEVAEFIAENLTESIRELEGALARISSVASMKAAPINLDAAQQCLNEILTQHPVTGSITVAEILETVQRYYHLKPKELLARSKVRSRVLPRQIGMYLTRRLTQLSLEEIGVHFGGRDHTTVLYATDRIEHLQKTNAQVRRDVHELKSRITSTRSIG
jgi:chromosomal replication initiator protein